jgi:hypothetical protein
VVIDRGGVPSDASVAPESFVEVQTNARTLKFVARGTREFGAQLEPGTAVRIFYSASRIPPGVCAQQQIETWLRVGDAIQFQYAHSGGTRLALPAGFSADFGEEYCTLTTACAVTLGRSVDVTDATGSGISLKPGGSDELGGYTIYAGESHTLAGLNEAQQYRGPCVDAVSSCFTASELLFVRTTGH